MKVIGKLVLFPLIVMVLLFTASDLFADVVGKISFVTGRVDILQKDQVSTVPVEVGAPVSLGDVVRTKSNSRAEITFLDDTAVRMAQNTRLEITNYLFDEKGARKGGVLSLFRGKIRAMVSMPFKVTPVSLVGTPDLEVHTPNAIAGVRGTDFYAIFEKGFSWFLVNGGVISAFSKDNPDEAIFITKKNCVKIGSGKTRRKLQGSCIYNPIDADRHGNDTDPRQIMAKDRPEEEVVFTYTPPPGTGVPGIDDPPLPPVGGADDPFPDSDPVEIALFPEDEDDGTPPPEQEFVGYMETAIRHAYDNDGYIEFKYTGVMDDGVVEAQPLWGGDGSDLSVNISGKYEHDGDSIWDSRFHYCCDEYAIYSGNEEEEFTFNTYDDGAFNGFAGGLWKDNEASQQTAGVETQVAPFGPATLEGGFAAIHIDNNGDAGVLLSRNLIGSSDPDNDYNGTFVLDGTVNRIRMVEDIMVDDISVDPEDLLDELDHRDEEYFRRNIPGEGSFVGGGDIATGYDEGLDGENYLIVSHLYYQDWGIWQFSAVGELDAETTSDTWNLRVEDDYDSLYVTETTGTQWSDGIIKGSTLGYGYGGAVADGSVWISVGDTFGTYDEFGYTWDMVSQGFYASPSQYLKMIDDSINDPALESLEIPFAQVGQTALSGAKYDGDDLIISVDMNDVVFLAPSNGAAPQIWLTDNIDGTYDLNPLGTTVELTGENGLSADFTVNQWGAGLDDPWTATVNGGGTYVSPGTPDTSMDGSTIVMEGVAAGSIDSLPDGDPGTFSGEGGGLVTLTP